MIGYVFTAAMTAVGAWALWRGITRRHDRPTGTTLWWIAGGIYALLIPTAAITNSPEVILAMMLVLMLGLPAIALVVEWLRRRERIAQRELAIAAGVPPSVARKQYRRAPRSFVTILAIYGGIAMLWAFVSTGIAWMVGKRSLVSEPTWPIPMAPGEEFPWWLAVMSWILLVGTIHAMGNSLRRA